MGDSANNHFDVLIIGGGINGAGIAREAQAAGYSVCLCEAGDFAGGTSSASTKLIHGGLRYLEHYEFRLVREALIEREVLWAMAPHIIWPMRFVLPHHSGLRPRWLLRLGLFLYDYLGGRKLLPATKTLNLRKDEAGLPLKGDFKTAFEYSDCWVEDSRLVILNLRDAQSLGASIRPRTRAVKAEHVGDTWQVELKTEGNERTEGVSAKLIVNAAGPWVDEVLRQVFGLNEAKNVRLVRGSHIVVPKKFGHDRAYFFQNEDERIIFAIPYENDFTLIGTTDAEQENINEPPKISDTEIGYLCDAASEYFTEPVTRDQIIWTYSGVRPLYDDGASKAQEATRDYVLKTEAGIGKDDLINVFGGKITTFRKLAKNMVEEIQDRLGKRAAHPAVPPHYPGGDFPVTGFEALVDRHSGEFPFIDRKNLVRLTRAYGTDVSELIGVASSLDDLGEDLGHGLYEAELRYLIEHEWSRTAEDVLYRRTKLGIVMNNDERAAVENAMTRLVCELAQ